MQITTAADTISNLLDDIANSNQINDKQTCLHLNCAECKREPRKFHVHMISCPCPNCSVYC